jgi:nitrous-oxide reductase
MDAFGPGIRESNNEQRRHQARRPEPRSGPSQVPEHRRAGRPRRRGPVGRPVVLQAGRAAAAAPAGAPAAPAAAAHGAAGDLNLHPAPGQLDTYYGVWSGGHSGEVRVLGLPSGREIKRVPTFNIDCMSGWGITNESKAIIGTKADGSLKYKTGDTHHIHGSYTDGTYDGKYYW